MIDWPLLNEEVTQLGEFVSDFNTFIRRIFAMPERSVEIEPGEIRAAAEKRLCLYAMSERVLARLEQWRQALPSQKVESTPDYGSLRETGAIADCHRLMNLVSEEISAKLFKPVETGVVIAEESVDAARSRKTPGPPEFCVVRGLVPPVVSVKYLDPLEEIVRTWAEAAGGDVNPVDEAIAMLPARWRKQSSRRVAILRVLGRSKKPMTPKQIRPDLPSHVRLDPSTIGKYLIEMIDSGCVFKAKYGDGYGLVGKHPKPERD